jgi:hypothetical protein
MDQAISFRTFAKGSHHLFGLCGNYLERLLVFGRHSIDQLLQRILEHAAAQL